MRGEILLDLDLLQSWGEVTDERTGDGRMLEPLVEHAEMYCRDERVILDGAYDSRGIFGYLAGKGIDPVIRVRRNISRRARARAQHR